MGEIVEARVVEERPNPWYDGLGWALLALMLLGIATIVFTPFPLETVQQVVMGGAGVLIAGALSFVVLRFVSQRRHAEVLLRIDGDGVEVDGRVVLLRAQLRQAGVHRDDGSFRIVLVARRSRVFVADSEPLARAAIEAAGFGAARRSFRTAFMSPREAWELAVPFVVYFFPLLIWVIRRGSVDASFFGVVLPSLAVAGTLYAWFTWTTVTIGSDGISIRRRRNLRFIPFSDVQHFICTGDDVVVVLRKGESVLLVRTLAQTNALTKIRPKGRPMQRELLADHLAEALRAYRARAGGPVVLSRLAREGRTTEAWVAGLRAFGDDADGPRASAYRTSPTRVDELEKILSDTAAAPDVRAGAAMALRVAVPDAVAKIRVAAEATAAPELREALEAIAAEREEEVERKMARIAR